MQRSPGKPAEIAGTDQEESILHSLAVMSRPAAIASVAVPANINSSSPLVRGVVNLCQFSVLDQLRVIRVGVRVGKASEIRERTSF